MNTDAHSSTDSFRLQWLETIALAVFAVIFWLVSINFPEPGSTGLDSSWQAILHYAHQTGQHFGSEIIFTYGPWGWLHQGSIPPGPVAARILWELFGHLFLTAVVLVSSCSLRTLPRWVFLGATLVLSGLFPDTLLTLVIVLLLLEGLMIPQSRARMVIAIIALAFLAQIKFTFALLATTGVLCSFAGLCIEGKLRTALIVPLIFVISSLVFWVAGGQNFGDIIPYIEGCLAISGGYPGAMFIPASVSDAIFGFTLVAVHAAAGLYILFRVPPLTRTLPFLMVLAAAAFLTWKHAFTRADGHVIAFFSLSPLIAVYLWGRITTRSLLGFYALLALTLGVGAIFNFQAGMITNTTDRLTYRLYKSITQLRQLPVHFANVKASDDELSVSLRSAVGNASVDVLGHEQGAALRAGLNYHNRPIPQSYSAYTPELQARNAAFYSGSDAPDVVLVKLQTIDGRAAMQDDALALLAIQRHYEFAGEVAGFGLFRRRSIALAEPLAPPRSARQPLAFGEILPLIPAPGHALWLRIHVEPTLLGRLRSFLFQPTGINLVVHHSDGGQSRHRIVPDLTQSGFIISPWLDSTEAFSSYSQGQASDWPVAVQLELRHKSSGKLWKRPEIELAPLNVPTLQVLAPKPSVLSELANLPLTSFKLAHPIETMMLDDRSRAFMLHAPSALQYTVPAGITQLEAHFGLRPDGQSGQAGTDGVTFRVRINNEDADSYSLLFERRLEPKTRYADQGVHSFRIPLPHSDNARIVILEALDPGNNYAWDCSYWSHIRFSSRTHD